VKNVNTFFQKISALRKIGVPMTFSPKKLIFSEEAQLFFDKYSCSCYNATTFYM